MKKALVFSALGPGSGCLLRASHVARGLRDNGFEAVCIAPFLPNLPFSMDALLAIPWFALIALFSRADLALGIKPYPNVAMALWILRLKGCNVVCDVDDIDWGWRAGLAGWLARMAQMPAFYMLKRFSTHHFGIKERLVREGLVPDQAWLPLDQGVAPQLFPATPAASKGPLVFVAHLNVACQLELLMEWLAPLLKKPGFPGFVVAGGGPRLRSWQARFESPQVRFTGPLDSSEAAGWMSRARVCLSAYAPGEGNAFRVPMKVLEYLASGRPVVTNLIPGLDPLRPYLYSCRADGRSFRKALLGVLKRKGVGREKKGRAFVLKKFNWKACTARFLAALG